MSSVDPMPRMRRHKRRLVGDGTELSHAVRDYIESVPLQPRQLGILGNGRSSGGAANAAPAMGGNGGDSSSKGSSDDTSSDDTGDESTSASETSTRERATPTTSSTSASVRTTAAATTTSSTDLIDQILSKFTAVSTTSTSSRVTSSTSTSTSTSSSTSTSTTSSTSSSIRSTSTSTSATSVTPITATTVVTSTPTRTQATIESATQSAKSTSAAAGPIIGIVAGSLVGVVVLSGLIGFLFKKYNKKSDAYEGNPFDRDEFHRHSTMIPDHFDSDDGHNGGLDGMSPEMSEHHQQFNNVGAFSGPRYESGLSAGVMAGAAGLAAGSVAHNEGGPRPPTMFARHAQHQQQQQQVPQVGGYYNDGDYSHMANMAPAADYGAPGAAFAGNGYPHGGYMEDPFANAQQQGRSISPVPQLPPLAAFGGDPYSIAGVGRNQQGSNVSNPYAHLDRVQPGQYISKSRSSGSGSIGSASSHENRRDPHRSSVAAAEALASGLAHQSSLNRSASNYTATPAPAYTPMEERDFGTQGRPGSSDRSGTPDLPNVQPGPTQHHYSGQISTPNHHNNKQLLVRNLVPDNRGASAGQRPVSSASSSADEEDAYGGVY